MIALKAVGRAEPRAVITFAGLAAVALVACRAPGPARPTLAGGARQVGQTTTGSDTASPRNDRTTVACAGPAPASQSVSLAQEPITDPLVTFDSAWSIIARTHWDTTYNGVNWQAVRDSLRPLAAQARTTGALRAVLSQMVGRLQQSHFSIIPREVSDGVGPSGGSAARDRSGSVGATFRSLDGVVVVSRVRRGGSAERAGVRTGWALEQVDGCPIAPKLARIPKSTDPRHAALLAYSLVTDALAGPVGDTVRLTFRDGRDARQVVAIRRDVEPGVFTKFGNLPPLNTHLEFERAKLGARTVGIIRFNIWMPLLSAQFDAAVDSLRDTDGIVLDLRGNFGGVGGMSMGIAGHFVDSALAIGTMYQRGLTMKFVANPRRVDTQARSVTPYAGPLALVVDELSISTTEIFAAGLQALGRARVFGAQTSGQALPAVPERLPNGDILYHAIADFLSPTGKPVEGDGVRPDVAAPLAKPALLAGSDPALDAAVKWAATPRPSAKVTPR